MRRNYAFDVFFGENLHEKLTYMHQKPVKAGLVFRGGDRLGGCGGVNCGNFLAEQRTRRTLLLLRNTDARGVRATLPAMSPPIGAALMAPRVPRPPVSRR